jgi:hypothetical protein
MLVALLTVGGLVTANFMGFRLGSDGMPTQIDGQPVYRVTDRSEWQNQNGEFLLAANLYVVELACMPIATAADVPSTPAERDLLGGMCSGVGLQGPSGATDNMPWVAPKSPVYQTLFGMWGRGVVLRVHVHDPEATGCSAVTRARCDAAVVAEAIVWQADEVAGRLSH